MPDFDAHFEEFLHLAGLGHDKALIAWGGFYFRRGDSPYGEWRIVDDEELMQVAPTPRSETIGAGSEPFGHATVEVERDGRVVRGTLVNDGRRYDNRFRTFPSIHAAVPVTFAVLGDFGVGIVDERLEG